jgi:hypothetical protein
VRKLRLADAGAFARVARRTAALRLGLLAVVVSLFAAALVIAARGERSEPPLAERGRTTVLVLDVSSSIEPRVYRQIGDTLGRAQAEGGRFGVVLFSDVAYELLPPGTPASELEGLRRYFTPLAVAPRGVSTVAVGDVRFLEAPWAATLTSGTRISSGLELAREVLEREGVANGKVVLVSDLEDEYADLPRLGRAIAGYAEARLPLRVVGLSPDPERLALFRRLLAGRGSVGAAAPPREPGSSGPLPPRPFPALLVAAMAALALALGVDERALARLPLRRDEGSS